MEVDPGALRDWLAARRPEDSDLEIGPLRAPGGSGFSNDTRIFELAYRRAGERGSERLVLRLEPPEPPLYPQQSPSIGISVEIQYRAMQAAARAAKLPLAPLQGYEPDRRVLGAPFFVMRFVDGATPTDTPLYTAESFYAEAKPEERRRMQESGLRVLAELHAIDWRSQGVDWLVPPGATPGAAAQLELYERYARAELGERRHPVLEQGIAWLRAQRPDSERVGLSWGDSRMGNMIWRDFECVAVTDWETCCVGPVELDLGWWLMFDRFAHEVAGVRALPGELSRNEQRRYYEACTGTRVGDTLYYEVFAALRFAAVMVRLADRMVARGVVPPEAQVWLRNPAADCLAQLMAL